MPSKGESGKVSTEAIPWLMRYSPKYTRNRGAIYGSNLLSRYICVLNASFSFLLLESSSISNSDTMGKAAEEILF